MPHTINATDIQVGDVLDYHGHIVTVTSGREDAPNQFGLPWFRFRVENDQGWGWAQFGPSGTAVRIN